MSIYHTDIDIKSVLLTNVSNVDNAWTLVSNREVHRFYAELGRLVRELRKEARLTQFALGKRVGLGRTSITNIELGEQHIPLHLLYPLASALGVTPDKLLPKPEFSVPPPGAARIDQKFANELAKQELSPSTKRWITRVVMKTELEDGDTHDDDSRPTRTKDSPRPKDRKLPNSG